MKQYRIEEICEVVSGGTPSTKVANYWDGDILWLTPKDLSSNATKWIYDSSSKITKAGLDNSAARMLPINTVLLSSRAPIGYLALAGKPLCTNQGFKSMICNGNYVLPEYLYYYLQTKVEELNSISTGSTFKELSGSLLKNYVVNLHDIATQQHIVDILGSIDNSIENNQSIMSKLIDLGLRVLQKAYNEQRYEKKRLGDCLCLLKDGTHNPPSRVEKGIPLITGQTIENGFIVYDKMTYINDDDYKKIHSKYAPTKNDLIITKIGTLGKVAILREQDIPIALHCNSALLRFEDLSPAVAFFALQSEEFQSEFHQKKNRTVQEFINLEQISNLNFLYPVLRFNEQNLLIALLDRLSLLEQENMRKNELKQLYLKKFFG